MFAAFLCAAVLQAVRVPLRGSLQVASFVVHQLQVWNHVRPTNMEAQAVSV